MRCKVAVLVLAVVTSYSLSASAAQAGVVFVSRPFDAFGTVDLTTGAYTSIGTTSAQLNALTFAPDGTLYGIGSDNTLYQVNTATAGLTKVGATGTFFGLNTLAGRSDGTLFGEDAFGDVYTVNAANGVATSVGPNGLSIGGVAGRGVALGPAGQLVPGHRS